MRFREALGPAESCWDSGENVVFTNSPHHEKNVKMVSTSIDFGGPGDTRITQIVKKGATARHMEKHIPKNTENNNKQMTSRNEAFFIAF